MLWVDLFLIAFSASEALLCERCLGVGKCVLLRNNNAHLNLPYNITIHLSSDIGDAEAEKT